MIAIIVPFYKNESYIHKCIESIIDQTYNDYKLFLIDDGSPDRCGDICDEYAKKHDNLIVIHQQNQGAAAARNVGIEMVLQDNEIEWIVFVDGDDWVHKEYLSGLLNACLESQTKISVCRYTKEDDLLEKNDNYDPRVTVVDSDSIGGVIERTLSAIVPWGKLFHKSIIGDVRFPVGKLFEDTFTVYKWLANEEIIAVVENALYYHSSNPSGMMLSKWTPRKLDILDAYYEQLVFYKNQKMMSSFDKTQYTVMWAIESSIIASNNNRDANKRIKNVINEINSEVYSDLSPEVRKRLKKVKSFGWFRFRNYYAVFRYYEKEKGLKYVLGKVAKHFRNK